MYQVEVNEVQVVKGDFTYEFSATVTAEISETSGYSLEQFELHNVTVHSETLQDLNLENIFTLNAIGINHFEDTCGKEINTALDLMTDEIIEKIKKGDDVDCDYIWHCMQEARG